ncbi:hypothetical protein G6L08_22620 [Agrobacterium rhizogenes]|nr:hypothetical protein [Rhizobium rhizogenes]
MTEIIRNVSEATETLREGVAEGEHSRNLPAKSVAALRSSGVFKMMMPREVGGGDCHPCEMVEALEIVSAADPAAGWCAMIGCDIGHYYRRLEPSARAALKMNAESIVAGWLSPIGDAKIQDDGILVSGSWAYASGINHANVVVLGTKLDNGDGVNRHVLALVEKDSVVVENNWNTLGLRASGSHNYTCNNVYVPFDRVLEVPAADVAQADPYSRQDILLSKMPGIPLGVANAAIAYARGLLRGDTELSGNETRRNVSLSQQCKLEAFGQALMLYRIAKDSVHRSLEEYWKLAERGLPVATPIRVHMALARYNAFKAADEVVRMLFDAFGNIAIHSSQGPLERLLRDITTMKQHAVAQRKIVSGIADLALFQRAGVAFV